MHNDMFASHIYLFQICVFDFSNMLTIVSIAYSLVNITFFEFVLTSAITLVLLSSGFDILLSIVTIVTAVE